MNSKKKKNSNSEALTSEKQNTEERAIWRVSRKRAARKRTPGKKMGSGLRDASSSA